MELAVDQKPSYRHTDRSQFLSKSEQSVLWYDTHRQWDPSRVLRLSHLGYTGLILYPENYETAKEVLSDRIQKVLCIESAEQLTNLELSHSLPSDTIISSADVELLAEIDKYATCLEFHVVDGPSLEKAIELGKHHNYLLISFQDPTNIPLELVIASLQSTQTVLIKKISDPSDVEDAVVTLGVMEVGADGVLFSPEQDSDLDKFVSQLQKSSLSALKIEVGEVIESRPVGMGYRSCIDLASIFSPNEGMLVGSTSQGGILCCPEVFYLPYMELRPFRINAGAVHSYVYNTQNKTNYLTELSAGMPAMIVDLDGNFRSAPIGRIKTEVRPLRLIRVGFESETQLNIIMQDDWHVRIFSDEGKPLNITQLQTGSKVLGHCSSPGRHVGIQVQENILEI